MKPPRFDYHAARSVEDALSKLDAAAGEAKVLAGGQSLVPMLNFRVLAPSQLVDIGRLRELDYIATGRGCLRVGALTRHRALETSALVRSGFPVLSRAMTEVAHLAVRNRGTIGGSLSHADPAAELPMLAILLDAEIELRGPAGPRTLPAADFLLGPLTTALADDELLTEVRLPTLAPDTGWGFEEVARRQGDFALAAAAATVRCAHGRAVEVRIALMGVDEVALRATQAEALLLDQPFDAELIASAAEAARDAVTPSDDLHASADYRRHLVEVLTRRVLRQAWAREPPGGRTGGGTGDGG